jgi:hypothetical protein
MDATAKEELGTVRREGGSTYKYVKFSGVGASAVVPVVAGDVVYYDIFDTTVHADISAATGVTFAIAAGQVQAAWDGVQTTAAERYGWVLAKGSSKVFLPTDLDGSPGIGDALTAIIATTPDKTLSLVAAADAPHYGVCIINIPGLDLVYFNCPQ